MIKGLFEKIGLWAPPLAPQTPDPYLEATQTELLAELEAGTLDGDRIIDAMMHIKYELFSEMKPLLKCRMMGVLSDEIHAIEMNPSAGERTNLNSYRLDMISVGQALAISTPVPESIVERMRKEEQSFMEDYRAGLEKTRGNGDFALDADISDHVEQRATKFNIMFGRHFGCANGVESEFYSDAQSKVTGYTQWNPFSERPVIGLNTAKVMQAKDLPLMAVTLGHEGVHGLARHLWNKYPDPEKYREKQEDFYMFMRLTDIRFYTTEDKEIYRRLPEENLAERIGLRLGAQVAQAHGFPLDVEKFKFSGEVYPTKEVIKEVQDLLKKDQRHRERELLARAPFMYP